MTEDLVPILTRFHREIVLPDIRRVVGEAVVALEGRMNAHFDAIYQRFDRLESMASRAKFESSRNGSAHSGSASGPP